VQRLISVSWPPATATAAACVPLPRDLFQLAHTRCHRRCLALHCPTALPSPAPCCLCTTPRRRWRKHERSKQAGHGENSESENSASISEHQMKSINNGINNINGGIEMAASNI